jgi:hypothetical protein
MTPDIVIGIPITSAIPNALDPNPTRAVMMPETRIMDPTRYFQKRKLLTSSEQSSDRIQLNPDTLSNVQAPVSQLDPVRLRITQASQNKTKVLLRSFRRD